MDDKYNDSLGGNEEGKSNDFLDINSEEQPLGFASDNQKPKPEEKAIDLDEVIIAEPEKSKKKKFSSKKDKKAKASQPTGEKVYLYAEPPEKKSFGKKVWSAIKFFYMVVTVPYFIILMLGIAGFIAIITSGGGVWEMDNVSELSGITYVEKTIMPASGDDRIAVIDVYGVIEGEQCSKFTERLKVAANDPSVDAVIIRVSSPGGSVSASDIMHHHIVEFKKNTNKPVYAFMSGVAASGGYYISVPCDEIMAEPTTITGSIGVIMQMFNMQGLFNEKLGIEAVTVKSGPRKDWPKMFDETTQEQLDYLDAKLIKPAYERFVNLVDQGRASLSKEDVLKLADGSIYSAPEAVNNGLIDSIGYLEDFVKHIAEINKLDDPTVFKYKEKFNLEYWLESSTKQAGILTNTRGVINEFNGPELMYLWNISN